MENDEKTAKLHKLNKYSTERPVSIQNQIPI